MSVVHVGLVHCKPCKYEYKGFYKRKVQNATCKDCGSTCIISSYRSSPQYGFLHLSSSIPCIC